MKAQKYLISKSLQHHLKAWISLIRRGLGADSIPLDKKLCKY